MKTRLGKTSLAFLFVIVIVLLAAHLVLRPAYATKIASADDSTAIAAVQTTADAIEILDSDLLALLGSGANIWYVDSGASGSDTGVDWTNAEETIEDAITNCTANAGDIIVCAPYHAETATITTFDLDKDGVKVIGLGVGDAMTTITYDGTTDICTMGASGDGCTIRNIKFYTATDNIATAIVVEDGCTDFIIEDCVFTATTTDEFLDTIYIHGTAANNGIIRNNRFEGDKVANAAPQSSIGFEDAHFLQIYDNEFSGDIAVAHIENKTTASNFVTIRDNKILCGFIGDAATNLHVTPGITLVATTTGWIFDNIIVTNVVHEQAAIVAADCYVFGNRYRELQGNTLEVGRTYTMVKETIVTGSTDQLFTVAGGPIEVISMFGQVTTDIAGTPGNVSITIDSATASQDGDLSIAVALADGSIGDCVVFGALTNSENAGVLTANEYASIPLSWFVTPGNLVQTLSGTGSSGAVTWYMTFRPLVEGVTVVVQ